jgi:DNA-binding MarR family transcriptional regulator
MMLSPSSWKVFEYVYLNPYSTIEEVGAAFGMTVGGAQYYLDRLKRAGLVTWEPGKARTLRAVVRYIPVGELATS